MNRLRATFACLSLFAPLFALGACQGVRTLSDPTLSIHTSGGNELGVSTEYGVVFLGHTADSGQAEITAWFGDGPDIEKTVIEPIGHGMFTADTQIDLPTIAISFVDPAPGSRLLVIGREGNRLWSDTVTVEQDPRVLGLITTIPARLRDAADQVGAGVYVVPDGDERARKLVGLVSGRMRIETTGKEYLTVVGPTDLWRLVSHRREPRNKKRWVYREDIL